ncbi:hypothetical protein QQZ08_010822 [Neonectria magnoliae]|uniref:Uncharacterized protein n=1 Tax=Neonectria magnoliae TaxID=2732573 RepID=A0ABR1HF62_9HYPO
MATDKSQGSDTPFDFQRIIRQPQSTQSSFSTSTPDELPESPCSTISPSASLDIATSVCIKLLELSQLPVPRRAPGPSDGAEWKGAAAKSTGIGGKMGFIRRCDGGLLGSDSGRGRRGPTRNGGNDAGDIGPRKGGDEGGRRG